MASNALYVATPQNWSILLYGQTGVKASGPSYTPTSLAFSAGKNGSCVWDIQALPLGTNTNTFVVYLWAYNPITGIYSLIGNQGLSTSTMPSAGSQFTTPSNGVVNMNSLLPVCGFPNSKTTTPLRKLELDPLVQVYCAGDRTSNGAGWQVNFYGGDY